MRCGSGELESLRLAAGSLLDLLGPQGQELTFVFRQWHIVHAADRLCVLGAGALWSLHYRDQPMALRRCQVQAADGIRVDSHDQVRGPALKITGSHFVIRSTLPIFMVSVSRWAA